MAAANDQNRAAAMIENHDLLHCTDLLFECCKCGCWSTDPNRRIERRLRICGDVMAEHSVTVFNQRSSANA